MADRAFQVKGARRIPWMIIALKCLSKVHNFLSQISALTTMNLNVVYASD